MVRGRDSFHCEDLPGKAAAGRRLIRLSDLHALFNRLVDLVIVRIRPALRESAQTNSVTAPPPWPLH